MTTEKKFSIKKRYIVDIYQSSLGFDKRPVLSVHLVVEAAGVTEVVAVPIPPPQRGRGCSTVHTLTTLWSNSNRMKRRLIDSVYSAEVDILRSHKGRHLMGLQA
jgi:hypothetical protein